MEKIPYSVSDKGILVKEDAAKVLRNEISSGNLPPGKQIVESEWAARIGVSQSSVREALHILANEGFVQKSSGRSARVTSFSADDVRDIYELRARIEGTAAACLARKALRLDSLREFITKMQQAAEEGDLQAMISNDLHFHLEMCEQSGNRFVARHASQLLRPLFAFTRMRAHTNKIGMGAWIANIPTHQRILDIIQLGDPLAVELFVTRIILEKFGRFAYDIWENRQIEISAAR